MRTSFLLLALAAAATTLPPLVAAQNDTSPPPAAAPKERGTPDTMDMQVDFQGLTSASLRMDQTWEGSRADDFRQSLDAYFGNGDAQLTQAEVQKVAAAAEKDMANKTFPAVGLDGKVATVTSARVTIDGGADAVNGTPITLHHVATLAFEPAGGDNHTVTIVPIWDGRITLTAPSGFVLVASNETKGVQVQPAVGVAKTPVSFTLRPPGPQDGTQSIQSKGESGKQAQAPTAPAPRKRVPLGGPLLLLAAVATAAALVRAARRR